MRVAAFIAAACISLCSASNSSVLPNVSTSHDKNERNVSVVDPEFSYPLGNVVGEFPNRFQFWSELLQSYDKGDPPLWGKGTVEVFVSFKLINLIAINEKANTFEADFMFRLNWVDERITWKPDDRGGLNVLVMTDQDEVENKIWRPDVCLSNVRKFTTSTSLMGQLTRVAHDGSVLWSRHISAIFANTYTLHMFPFDYQVLPIYLDSYKFSTTFQAMDWTQPSDVGHTSPALTVGPEIFHPAYSVVNTTILRIMTHVVRFKQTYARLEGRIIIQRHYFPFFPKVIVPIFVIIMLSTYGYRIDPVNDAPARCTLSMMCVLIQIVYMNVVSRDVPEVAYLTWLDIYTTVAFAFNVLSMLTFTFVLHNITDNGYGDEETGKMIDAKSKTVIPALFTLFTMGMLLWAFIASYYPPSEGDLSSANLNA